MDLSAIKGAAETMFAEQTWESFIALIQAVLGVIFGFVAKEEDLAYPAE